MTSLAAVSVAGLHAYAIVLYSLKSLAGRGIARVPD